MEFKSFITEKGIWRKWQELPCELAWVDEMKKAGWKDVWVGKVA